MSNPALLILILAAVAIAVWLVINYRRRRRMLTGLALRFKWQFFVHDRLSLLDRLGGLYLMQLGHAARVFNVLYGRRDDRRVIAFDYCYETGAGTELVTHRRSVVACSVGVPLPATVALRESSFMPLGRHCDFESVSTGDAAFDNRFVIHSDQTERLRTILSAPLRQALLQYGLADWEFNGNYLVLYVPRVLSALKLARLIRCGARCSKLLALQNQP